MACTELEAQPPRHSVGIAPNPEFNLPPRPSSICENCWTGPFAAQLGLSHDGGYSYLVWTSELEQRASAGCAWCKLLLGKISRGRQFKRVKEQPERRLSIKVVVSKPQVRFTPTDVQELRVIMDDKTWVLQKYLTTSETDPAAPYIVARDLITDVRSTRTLSLAKELIDECVHGHERCTYVSPPSDVRLPTRLIDCTDPARPRLASTKGGHGKYLALSYVWGGAQPHKTTGSNISMYPVGIPVSLLPQTIRDAIYVTHTLGFRYLWADSLCIIQDSDEDRLREIRRMHLIYRHAHLTIIAASAQRVSDGFLEDRPAPLPEVTLPFICPPCTPSPGDHAQQVGELHCYSLGPLSHHPKEPVNGRGWCLQEVLLSPRALVFTSQTLRFRCQNAVANVGNSLYYAPESRLPDVLFRPVSSPVPRDSKEWRHAHKEWALIVREYCDRTLGEPSDKLVACGALAEAFHRVLGCDYRAGLWRDTLLEDLLWDTWTRESGYIKDRPAEYRAPSWSWAAVDGKFTSGPSRHHYSGAVVSAQVVRCDVTLKNPELPFGEVTGGTLVLRARLILCKVCKADNSWGAEILLPPLSGGRCSGGSDHVAVDHTMVKDEKLDPANCFVDHLPDLLVERDSDWLLPFWWKIDGGNTWPAVGGLILTLANPNSGSETAQKKVYRRIGTFLSGRASGRVHLSDCYAREKKEEIEIV